MEYSVVIGLEVHVQLLTRTKLFCGCCTTFGADPNTQTCPVCTGMPGTLPVMNAHAFELALKTALAINCEIAEFTKWDRKNYYYPDLPKNYQISQYDLPFSENGFLDVTLEDEPTPKRIRIIRAHLEEDAGKLIHGGINGTSQVDLNRTGTPLLEIVSHPDMTSPQEARAYLEQLRLLLVYLGVSDCNMQEGSLRCDANINLHIKQPDGTVAATPIVEVKNLNSFRGVERAMTYEIKRQLKEWNENGKKLGEVPKATAGWNDEKGETVIQRRKEEASDYRYFPDPDLVPVNVSREKVAEIKSTIGELPAACLERFQTEYGLSVGDAGVIIDQGKPYANYFEAVARSSGSAKAACNWMQQDVLRYLNEEYLQIEQFPVTSSSLGDLLAKVTAGTISTHSGREVFAEMLETGQPADEIIKAKGLEQVSDEAALRAQVQEILDANPSLVDDFKKGKKQQQIAGFARGLVMKATRGKANAQIVGKLIDEEFARRTS